MHTRRYSGVVVIDASYFPRRDYCVYVGRSSLFVRKNDRSTGISRVLFARKERKRARADADVYTRERLIRARARARIISRSRISLRAHSIFIAALAPASRPVLFSPD